MKGGDFKIQMLGTAVQTRSCNASEGLPDRCAYSVGQVPLGVTQGARSRRPMWVGCACWCHSRHRPVIALCQPYDTAGCQPCPTVQRSMIKPENTSECECEL